MICHLHRLGIDKENVYDEIVELARKAPQFRFDWWMRSRTAADIQRRCNTLVGLVEKEMLGDADDRNKGRKGPKLMPQLAATTPRAPSTPVKKRIAPSISPRPSTSGIQKKKKDTLTSAPVSRESPIHATRTSARRKKEWKACFSNHRNRTFFVRSLEKLDGACFKQLACILLFSCTLQHANLFLVGSAKQYRLGWNFCQSSHNKISKSIAFFWF